MAEKRIRRSINFIMERGKPMSSGSSFSNAPQPLFKMNPWNFTEGPNSVEIGVGGSQQASAGVPIGSGHNYYAELGISSAQYSAALIGRELEEVSLVYKMGSLPEAEIPNLSDTLTSTEATAAKRDWIWKSARKEVDALSINYYVDPNPIYDEDNVFLSSWVRTNETPDIDSFYGTVSLRGIVPFYRQEITPMFPPTWGTLACPAVAVRQCPWGNLVDDDVVSVVGSYSDVVEVLPKRALGIIL